jgi:hypothetical protein
MIELETLALEWQSFYYWYNAYGQTRSLALPMGLSKLTLKMQQDNVNCELARLTNLTSLDVMAGISYEDITGFTPRIVHTFLY